MKFLVANYRYFISGGPERYMFGLMDALAGRGHECVPFSIRYDANLPTPYADYFAEPLDDGGAVYFRDQSKSPRAVARTVERLFYSPDVARRVQRLARDTRPDAAFVQHYLRKLSPSLLVGLKKAGLPIIVRLSDYAMICPQTHMTRNGGPCHDCVGGSLLPSIRHRCVHGSLAGSLLNAAATSLHRRLRLFDHVDCFLAPSRFLRERMIEGGIAPERVRRIPTFVDLQEFAPAPQSERDGDLAVFAGRLDLIKGVDVLVRAMGLLRAWGKVPNFRLELAGDGPSAHVAGLQALARELGVGDRMRFLGRVAPADMAALVARASFTVAPSQCYENMPNSVLESLASGVPVVAADIGSLSECVEPGRTGLLFTPGDAESMARAMLTLAEDPALARDMGRAGRQAAMEHHNRDAHVDALLALFKEIV